MGGHLPTRKISLARSGSLTGSDLSWTYRFWISLISFFLAIGDLFISRADYFLSAMEKGQNLG
jgi:hypothetical protein